MTSKLGKRHDPPAPQPGRQAVQRLFSLQKTKRRLSMSEKPKLELVDAAASDDPFDLTQAANEQPPASPAFAAAATSTAHSLNAAAVADTAPIDPPLADIIGVPRDTKIACPFHSDNEPSCHIYDDHFYCFGCGAHGDAIDWLTHVGGYAYTETVEVLETWDGSVSPPRNDATMVARAHELWDEAQPIAGTLAERYLVIRGIDVEALPGELDAALRFHPHCPFGKATRHPCLVALFRDVETGAPAGIHRTALTSEAQKIDRMMLGRWPAPRAIKLWSNPVDGRLAVGEGIETVLAAATRTQHRGAPLTKSTKILYEHLKDYPTSTEGFHEISIPAVAAALCCEQMQVPDDERADKHAHEPSWTDRPA
jgi:hypothetical protein